MKIAVAGATGFVGKYLMQYFSDNDIYAVKLPRDINRHDLAGVDCVINLVGRAHLMGDVSIDGMNEYDKVNCQYAVNLYDACKAMDVKKFIHTSSIGVLGNTTTDHPFNETSPLNPVENYAISKAKAEIELNKRENESRVGLCIIRPPLIYGKNAPGNIKRLTRLIQSSIPLPFGSINNRKDFISIYNFCDFIHVCVESDNVDGKTFLVSDGESLSTPELIQYLAYIEDKRFCQFSFPVSLLKLFGILTGKSQLMSRITESLEIDISYTKKILNWKPKYSVSQSFDMIKSAR